MPFDEINHGKGEGGDGPSHDRKALNSAADQVILMMMFMGKVDKLCTGCLADVLINKLMAKLAVHKVLKDLYKQAQKEGAKNGDYIDLESNRLEGVVVEVMGRVFEDIDDYVVEELELAQKTLKKRAGK